MREELAMLLEDKPLSDRKRTERDQIEAYVKSFQERMNDLQTEYGLTYRAVINYSKNGILPGVEVVPFNPEKKEQSDT